jgi:glucose/mannose-6-phosphate isomerase
MQEVRPMAMSDIFSEERAAAVDRSEVRADYAEWPDLARRGLSSGVDVRGVSSGKVAVLGMGGSASVGDLIGGWLADRDDVQVAVYKGHLPRAKMDDTLAIVCSASGDTSETIRMMDRAMENGARVVTISSGGKLEKISADLGVPRVTLPAIKAPRYMLPFIVFSAVSVLDAALGLRCAAEASAAVAAMERLAPTIGVTSPEEKNEAKQLARAMLEVTPKAYGTVRTRGVGVRFTNALNENAKRNGFYEEIPEALHNDIETWEHPDPALAPFFLSFSGDEEEDAKRIKGMENALTGEGVAVREVSGTKEGELAELMTLAYKLDMSTYFLAVGLGRDPFPTRLLTQLKGGL